MKNRKLEYENIKDYNLEELKEELVAIGEKSIVQNRFLNGYM